MATCSSAGGQLSAEGLGVRQVRRVYLITYSHADTSKVSSRQCFADLVLEAFENSGVSNKSTVEQWACCLERHRAGGIHFHMASNSQGHGDGWQLGSFFAHDTELTFTFEIAMSAITLRGSMSLKKTMM